MLRWKFEDSLPLLAHFQNGCPEENAEKPKIQISVSEHLIIRYTHFISRYMFLMMTNTVILFKNSLHMKKDFKIHDGRQFWPKKIVISMKSTNMPVSILPKTKGFKVLCVFIANYGVNNEKSEIHGLPGVLKMLTMEESQKPKLTITVRQLLCILDLYNSTLNNDIIHSQ